EVKRVAENTQWNGTNILDGNQTATTFQVGANASQTIAVNFGDLANNTVTGALSGSITPEVTSGSAAAAFADIAITGTVAAGDVITVRINDTKYASFTLDATSAAALNTTDASADDAVASTITVANGTGHTVGDLVGTVASGKLRISGTLASSTGTNPTFTVGNIESSRGTHAPVGGSDITTSALANTALGVLDTAIEGVNSTRAGLGASMSRLEYASDNLQNVAQNTSSARSRVLDADYAAETTELARTQIIQQAATAMLAQANQSQQAVLALLK
ncbi:MAG: hypothetical protein CMQ13_04030, partial [Gammaproteobacteria bacterium]|nr:hypothetical protein [Gammaproteobacteria bacterium]